jgi:hypothetical protein
MIFPLALPQYELFSSNGDGVGITDIPGIMDGYLHTRKVGPRGTRQKKLQNLDPMNQLHG